MTAIIAAIGWKVIVAIGAFLAAALIWFASLSKAKKSGVSEQQTADLKKKEADLEQANKASGSVNDLSDDAAISELHAAYDRKPLRMGEGDHRIP